jgi:glyoxylase-like metal-dependent hydrolase (beta-lactamase superfamily II)
MSASRPEVQAFLHPQSSTWTYLVSDPGSRRAAVIDPALDLDLKSGRVSSTSVQAVIQAARDAGVTVDWILETHAHADHLSAAQVVKQALGGQVAIGAGIRAVQAHFKAVFNLGPEFKPDGTQFDRLFVDGETFAIGTLEARVMATPGHTPDSLSYLIGDAAFVGDSIFMPDSGTARCDFPGGDARTLYHSIQRLYGLPEATRLFMCHDYGTGGRPHAHLTSVSAERAGNIHAAEGVSEAAFVKTRETRDASLEVPALLYPALLVNIRAGHLPPAESNGTAYLKIPLHLE